MHDARLKLAVALVVGLGSVAAACKDEAPREVAKTAVAELSAAPLPDVELYAASNRVRVLSAAQGAAVGGIELGRTIRDIVFSQDGAVAFLATSAGIYEVDAKARVLGAQLSTSPARAVRLSGDGSRLWILEHDVIVEANGTRDIRAYRLRTIEVSSHKTLDVEEIGQRVALAVPAIDARNGVVLYESGAIVLVPRGTALSDGEPIALGNERYLVRGARVHGSRAMFVLEGKQSELVELDLESGRIGRIVLPGVREVRGVDFGANGDLVVVNAARQVAIVDRPNARIAAVAEVGDWYQGVELSRDARFAFLMQTVDGTGGAVGVFDLQSRRMLGKIHIQDTTPITLALRPSTSGQRR